METIEKTGTENELQLINNCNLKKLILSNYREIKNVVLLTTHQLLLSKEEKVLSNL